MVTALPGDTAGVNGVSSDQRSSGLRNWLGTRRRSGSTSGQSANSAHARIGGIVRYHAACAKDSIVDM
jgi:hypothetical protein